MTADEIHAVAERQGLISSLLGFGFDYQDVKRSLRENRTDLRQKNNLYPSGIYSTGGIFLTCRSFAQHTIEEGELDEKAVVSKTEITTKKESPLARTFRQKGKLYEKTGG